MIRVRLDLLRDRAKERPGGYYEDVLAHGQVRWDEMTIEFEDEVYAELLARYRPDPPRTLAQKLANFGLEAAKWVAAGLPMVSREVLEARAASCYACAEWVSEGLFPHCRVCGCLELKHELATTECPRGHWGKGSAMGLQAP